MKSEKQLDTIRHFSVFSVSFSLPLHFNAIGSQSPETHDRDWTRKDLSHNGPSRTFWPPPWLFVQFLATRIMGNTIKAQIWQKRVLRNYINMTNFNVTIKFDSYLYTILYYSYATLDREYCSGLSWKIYYKYIYIYIFHLLNLQKYWLVQLWMRLKSLPFMAIKSLSFGLEKQRLHCRFTKGFWSHSNGVSINFERSWNDDNPKC